MAIKRSDCFHKRGHATGCHVKNKTFMIIFGIIEVILSQTSNFQEVSWLAAIMPLGYSCIGLGLLIARVARGSHAKTTLMRRQLSRCDKEAQDLALLRSPR
ncbi:hypothetical protein V6N13_106202 [Hibiscus sabdariffa]|uniref:Amino acid transporter transmembrane domain-containing protein n=1 Tax=Hibiscus sabdariffa TaxID=183260 RepID=A0ABR2EZY2_9ROSI